MITRIPFRWIGAVRERPPLWVFQKQIVFFGKSGNGLSFGGAGEHLIVKGFKGIVNDKARTVSVWLKTTDIEGSVLSQMNGNLGYFCYWREFRYRCGRRNIGLLSIW